MDPQPSTAEPAEPAEPEQLQAAADLFEARQSGTAEPEGAWADRVWLPTERERRPCCEGLEPDRLKDPQKLRNHCRTLLHVSTLFDVDSRLLRAELKRRRKAREEALGKSDGVGRGPQRVRPTSPARRSPGAEAPSGEALAFYTKVVRLLADKRAALLSLTKQAGALCAELHRQLADEGQAVEVVLAETGAADLAGDLKALIDEIQHLAITRDTIRRVL